MKKLLQFVKIPQKLHVPMLVVSGVIIGFVIILLNISNAFSYLNEKPETCVNCHVMNSLYASWNHSSHREQANCVDCHMPHDFIGKYYVKARDGMKDVYKFTLRMETDVPHASDETKEIIQNNCIYCHKTMMKSVNPIQRNTKHHTEWNGKQCWDCHREIPHSRTRGLTSTPNMSIQLINKPVPDWLDKKLNIQ